MKFLCCSDLKNPIKETSSFLINQYSSNAKLRIIIETFSEENCWLIENNTFFLS